MSLKLKAMMHVAQFLAAKAWSWSIYHVYYYMKAYPSEHDSPRLTGNRGNRCYAVKFHLYEHCCRSSGLPVWLYLLQFHF